MRPLCGCTQWVRSGCRDSSRGSSWLPHPASGAPSRPASSAPTCRRFFSSIFFPSGTGGSRHGGGGAADGSGNASNAESTFLMYSTSMFRPAMELLFGRMAPAMLGRAQRQVAKWALGSTLPGVTCEVGVVVCAAVWADPLAAGPLIVSPLLARLLEEARTAVAAAALGPLSASSEGRLRYVASMLQGAIQYAGPGLPPLAAQLKEATELLFETARRARSIALAESASMLLGTNLVRLAPLPAPSHVRRIVRTAVSYLWARAGVAMNNSLVRQTRRHGVPTADKK